MKSSLDQRTSRYVAGGVSETSGWSIEWWNRTMLTLQPTDTTYVVEKKFEGRLDLIAAALLGEPRYWWMIAQLNNVLDPAVEVVENVLLYIPSRERVKLLLGSQLGGTPSTRVYSPSMLPVV